MHKIGKLVASMPYADEKGNMTVPPKETLEMSIKNNKDWIEISVQESVRDKGTDR